MDNHEYIITTLSIYKPCILLTIDMGMPDFVSENCGMYSMKIDKTILKIVYPYLLESPCSKLP